MSTSPFVSTDWLAAHLNDPDVTLIDASWYLPTMNRDGEREFADGHIPNAQHFNIDTVADHSTNLPHMLPTPEEFARIVGTMGISHTDHIVIYDGAGLFAAARVWWTFRVMGADHVSILEGGAPKWKSEGRAWTSATLKRTPKLFKPTFNTSAVADLTQIKTTLHDHSAQIVDARPADRFKGDAPEPRPGLKSGHMPGSFNVPFSEVVKNGALLDKASLHTAFQKAGVDLSKPIITSCGSGVSAAILALALETLGAPAQALYDGSWAEWGGRDECEVAKG
jgi:thiosulfate/3-mercaptopyruvate sulfurtransferase